MNIKIPVLLGRYARENTDVSKESVAFIFTSAPKMVAADFSELLPIR